MWRLWQCHWLSRQGYNPRDQAHCAQLAQEAGAKQLVITHLNPTIDPETLLKEARVHRIDSRLARIGDQYDL